MEADPVFAGGEMIMLFGLGPVLGGFMGFSLGGAPAAIPAAVLLLTALIL